MRCPNNLKYRKYHKIKYKKGVYPNHKLFKTKQGETGLQAEVLGKFNIKNIESVRKAIGRKIKREGKSKKKIKGNGLLWVNIFPWFSITKKSQGVRMGKGKGKPNTWISIVKRGQMIYEVSSKKKKLLKLHSMFFSLLNSKSKIPFKIKVVRSIF